MPATINEVEASVQQGLEALRNAPLNEQISFTLRYLVPDGYRPIVQFEEDGRKKRSTASADTWNPETGEIVIFFEPIGRTIPGQPPVSPPSPVVAPKDTATPATGASSGEASATEAEIAACCEALGNAEKAGKHFIALKWFRDDLLPTISPAWAQSPSRRQAILTQAIESGKIGTKKIPNPKAPQFPTTTISLNRDVPLAGVTPRFRPVPVRGEPASETLLRDRGPY